MNNPWLCICVPIFHCKSQNHGAYWTIFYNLWFRSIPDILFAYLLLVLFWKCLQKWKWNSASLEEEWPLLVETWPAALGASDRPLPLRHQRAMGSQRKTGHQFLAQMSSPNLGKSTLNRFRNLAKTKSAISAWWARGTEVARLAACTSHFPRKIKVRPLKFMLWWCTHHLTKRTINFDFELDFELDWASFGTFEHFALIGRMFF